MNLPPLSLQVWLGILSSVGFLVGLGIVYWMHSQYHLEVTAKPVPPPMGPVETLPLITVIIPARNEARNIERCVREVLAQTYPRLQVIVVDDRSTDDTPRILAMLEAEHRNTGTGPSLQIVQGKDMPSGWAGKPHALFQGAALAGGSWLCFLDADTFASPELVASAYATAVAHQADLFSILTRQELGTFWEKVIQPLVFTALSIGFSPRRVNDPRYPDAIANGQFIFIRASVYAAVGGHAALRDQIVEDKALAVLVKHSGYRLLVADGQMLARTRMYTSLSEIWEGWTKNIYLGMRDQLALLVVGACVGLLGALVLPFWLVGAVSWFLLSGLSWAGLAALQAVILWIVLIYIRMQASRAFGISPGYAFTFPLGAIIFTGMMFFSAWNVLTRRGVTWKGRRYLSS